jgi:uncharacterized protein YfaS (alpha-2-macroglobulin family)
VPQYADIRDDRLLFFVDLHQGSALTLYTLVRAVSPGTFALPPAQAEAMYNPAFHAATRLESFTVTR